MELELNTTEVAEVVPKGVVAEEVLKEGEVKPDESASPDPAVAPKKKETAEIRKARLQREIDELVWRKREAERALQSEPAKPQPTSRAGRPKVDQFETVEAYEDALLTWHETKRATELTLVEQNKKKKEAVETFNAKADSLRAQYDDYDEIISAPIFTETMKNVLLTSENGPELAYEFGKNRAVADKIAKLPPELQPYEIGKFETQYMLSKKNKKTTTAPTPINPIGATGETTKIDESKLDDNEWYKLEQKRKLEKLKKLRGD
jgi:hypothetical protein